MALALWVCPPCPVGQVHVRVEGHWPFGCAPLPDGGGSFVRVEGQRPFECATLPDVAVDRRIGPSTSECTKVLNAVEPGSGASYLRPLSARVHHS